MNDILSSILFATGILVLYIAYFSWKNSKSYISYCLITVAIYGVGYGFEIMKSELWWMNFWLHIEYIGIVFLPVAWISFVLQYTGQKEILTKKLLIFMMAVSTVLLGIVYTNPWHHLYYKEVYVDRSGPFPIAGLVRGPLFWLDTGYAYVGMAIGIFILIRFYVKSIAVIKKQVRFVILGWIVPWIADIVYSFHVLPFHLDLCPFAFCVSGIISSLAIFNFNFIKLTPIAIEKVFLNMADGVIILDNNENIVNYNPSARYIIRNILGIPKEDADLKDKFMDYKKLKSVLKNEDYNAKLIKIVNEKEEIQYYKMTVSKIHQQEDKKTGEIVIFSDVTQIELARKAQADNYIFLQTILDAIPNPIYSKDETGRYTQCNHAFSEFLGIEKEYMIGKNPFDLFEKEMAQKFCDLDKELLDSKENQMFETKLCRKDGTNRNVYFSKSVIQSSNNHKNQGIVGIVVDITERKKNEEKIIRLTKLKESMLKIGYKINEISEMNELLTLILYEVIACVDENSCGSVLILDDYDMLKIAVSKGYNNEEVKQFSVSVEHHLKWINHGESLNKTVICNNIDLNPYIHMLKTEHGEQIKSTISSPIILEGKLYGFLSINSTKDMIYGELEIEMMEYMRNQAANVIMKHKLYETTLYLSRYDHLTNVFNRNYFENLFFETIKQEKAQKNFYLVLFDLNDLKHVNDVYGHLAGDAAILKFADGLRFELSINDFIGRYGGDEFVGVFFDISQARLEEKFRFLLLEFRKKPVMIEDSKIICSFSYGMAKYPEEGTDFNQLVKLADERMYYHKNKRKKQRRDFYVPFMGQDDEG